MSDGCIPRRRLWGKAIRVFAGLLCLMFLVMGSLVTPELVKIHHWRNCLDRLRVCSRLIESQQPMNIDKTHWQAACQATDNAFGNVFFGHHRVDPGLLTNFTLALEQKTKSEPASVATLDWIWEELARIEACENNGSNYGTRFRVLYLEALGPFRSLSRLPNP